MRECQDKADEFDIKNRVIFAGQLKNIDQMLNATDIFVLPSFFEAFPRSIIEAMGAGKPVIATNVGGCSEALEDKISGFLVSAKDSDALADKIFSACKDQKFKRQNWNEARHRVENCSRLKIMSNRPKSYIMRFYRHIK